MPPNSAWMAERASPKLLLLDRYPQRVGAARNAAQIDRDRLAYGIFQDAHGLGLGAHCRNVGAVGLVEHEGRAVQQGVMQHVAAHGDRGAMKHRVHMDGAVIAHIFAERPFRLDIAAFVEITLERHLGVGGNENIVGQAFHHRRRLGAEAGDQRQLIARLPRGRGEEIERMRADGKRHRQFLAARHRGGVDAFLSRTAR